MSGSWGVRMNTTWVNTGREPNQRGKDRSAVTFLRKERTFTGRKSGQLYLTVECGAPGGGNHEKSWDSHCGAVNKSKRREQLDLFSILFQKGGRVCRKARS